MKRLLFAFIALSIIFNLNAQIIADHTVVDKYTDIPQRYIDSVKRMWVSITGASHAEAYRMGCWQLDQIDSNYPAATVYQGEPLPYRTTALRVSGSTWGNYDNETGWTYMNGQEDWWTNDIARGRIKAYLQYCHDNGPALSAHIYGWSFDAQFDYPPGGDYDPTYHVRWAGSTREGPDGNGRWGLDAADFAQTNNSVCMDTYLNTVKEYNDYCAANGIPTIVIYSTGAVDDNGDQAWSSGERGYQQFLKWEHIRQHVSTLSDAYFFDYADILCYNDNSELATTTWEDNSGAMQEFPIIHPDNMEGGYIGHIGYNGAVRLAKALWWLLAREAGWDGTVNGEDNIAPSVPSGLTASSISASSVEMSWNSSSDNVSVTGYRIFRNDVEIGTSATNSYTDNTVAECADYTYSVSAYDAAGNESSRSTGLLVSTCAPDLATTLIVTPNISHGITVFDVLIKITELNSVDTNGEISVNIPVDSRWVLEGGFDNTLTILDGMPLNNEDWSYSSDAINHNFSSSVPIPAGGYSTIGFSITFNPDTNRGLYNITTQLVSGSGGEIRVTNNADSERLDYFQ